MELYMDCLTPRILLQKVCSYKYQFCTKACASSRLVSQAHMMAKQNIKKKYLMCQISIKMVKQHAIPNSSLHNLKIYSSKECGKTSQSWINIIYVAKHIEHSNSNYSNFQQMITSDYGFLLRLVNTFTIETDEYYPMCYRVNMMSRPLKTLYIIILRFVLITYHHHICIEYCRLARLTRAFKIILI